MPGTVGIDSAELGNGLSDAAKFDLWRAAFVSINGPLTARRAENLPFRMQFAYRTFGSVGAARMYGTITEISTLAAAGDDFVLIFNIGSSPILCRQDSREALLHPGAAVLHGTFEPGLVRSRAGTSQLAVTVPRARLLERVDGATDRLCRPVAASQPVVSHLRRYLNVLTAEGGEGEGGEKCAMLDAHVEAALLDLVALTLGAGAEADDVVRARGIRAARLRILLNAISTGYDDADFSLCTLTGRIGMSARYVQDLLHETGRSFSERVRELRLQKARSMLTSRQCEAMSVTEIASACGFGEASSFNRAFRRRFGETPTQARRRVGLERSEQQLLTDPRRGGHYRSTTWAGKSPGRGEGAA